ncbi:MAG: hypothetical protein A2381_05480 [Bdellovibrionales bacterium RIFOXYB1_FULL_37_110]|nr:MAG: hypothetical protein A2181_03145 [Bdellovibrionales bacterium RIFOXYA1_FULL_38_20]OFZ46630.1 MAG: hypothetical protein A2417_14420 [Bdellovibrionales bacterium RIFOXYC1_FULL_37_79]OFZ57372.1 MAG: hypothetical protein A2381_05480 [Bdellovibrionales bacterium RIFOXYB1_FULL_37_110]OFZ62540.1 MAG: hypothetical protein A2577_08325 [Bdellovibrionales bacterium RIFOXYD1_FULL_36_51]
MIGKDDKNSLIGNVVKEVRAEKRKGRKSKNNKVVFKINKEQTRFRVDLGRDLEVLRKVFDLLEKANNKEYGRKITFKDLAFWGITKISSKDMEKIQKASMTKMEKVERFFNELKAKTSGDITHGEFLVKKLNIVELI